MCKRAMGASAMGASANAERIKDEKWRMIFMYLVKGPSQCYVQLRRYCSSHMLQLLHLPRSLRISSLTLLSMAHWVSDSNEGSCCEEGRALPLRVSWGKIWGKIFGFWCESRGQEVSLHTFTFAIRLTRIC